MKHLGRVLFYVWFLAAAFGGIFSAVCEGKSLVWTSTEQQFKAKTGDDKIVATYSFKNTGSAPVRIVSVTSTCTCTTGQPDKDIYGPEETGELKVQFDVGPQVGRQERPISVSTDDAPGDPTVLTIVVDITETVLLQPKLLFWKIGESGDEKTVKVSLADPNTTTLNSVRVGRGDFSCRLEKTDTPGQYRVWVKPANTTKPVQTIIYLDGVVEGTPRSFAIFAAVK